MKNKMKNNENIVFEVMLKKTNSWPPLRRNRESRPVH